jgi:DNA-directed RNA polymerase alpha subunit
MMAEKVCNKGHKFTKSSDCLTCPICAREESESIYSNGFPKIGSPALNALKHFGITPPDLPKYSEDELLRIHGIGPKAIDILRKNLAEKGLRFNKSENS